jgi:hydrogenase maturation protease
VHFLLGARSQVGLRNWIFDKNPISNPLKGSGMREALNSASETHTLVLGVGNPLCGDDGVGARIIELLGQPASLSGRTLPPGACVQDAGLPGWGLPSWLEGWSRVFLVDAVEMGLEPGEWRRFCPEEVKYNLEDEAFSQSDLFSLHQPGLACGLALAQALDLLPEELVIYGVQPADTTPGAPLSPQVNACLPQLVEQLLNDISNT